HSHGRAVGCQTGQSEVQQALHHKALRRNTVPSQTFEMPFKPEMISASKLLVELRFQESVTLAKGYFIFYHIGRTDIEAGRQNIFMDFDCLKRCSTAE